MAQREVKQWITMNGKHIPIFEGESKAAAVKRATAKQLKEDEDKKEKQIAANKKEADRNNGKEKSLDEIDDAKELQQQMHKMFIEEGSYVNDPEFRKLQKDYSEAFEETGRLHDKAMELYATIEKETVVDEDVLKEFRGDKQLAKLFAEKTEKGQAAEKELQSVREQDKENTRRRHTLEEKLDTIRKEQSSKQKEAFEYKDITVKKADFKDDFDGFETDTHTPKYKRLVEEGKATLVSMSPKEYLEYCAYKIFPHSTYEQQVYAAIGDARHTMDLVNLMKNGTKMYCPVLDFNEKEQEGRHRALAAMILGLDKIPVVVVK